MGPLRHSGYIGVYLQFTDTYRNELLSIQDNSAHSNIQQTIYVWISESFFALFHHTEYSKKSSLGSVWKMLSWIISCNGAFRNLHLYPLLEKRIRRLFFITPLKKRDKSLSIVLILKMNSACYSRKNHGQSHSCVAV